MPTDNFAYQPAKNRNHSCYGIGLALLTGPLLLAPFSAQAAEDYDMDCAVILCLAGGFPAGCGEAYDYMIDRITDFPNPKPPFGICTGSDGKAYSNIDAPYNYLHRESPAGWYCPKGSNLFHQVSEDDHGRKTVHAFCYSHRTTKTVGVGKDRETETIWHGKSAAQPVNFRIRITVEPGTAEEYRSPLFKLNYRTGFFVAEEE